MTVYFGNGSGNLYADRRYEWALSLLEGGEWANAADLLKQGLELAPAWPPMHFYYGEACRLLGRLEDAQRAFDAYLQLDAEDIMGAMLKISLMTDNTASPAALPDAYIRSLFDQYAPAFETALVKKLSYRAPDLVAEAVRTMSQGPFSHILDLGCGTGLAAEKFVSHAEKITGVDISPGMIEIAKSKNIYTDLVVAKIESYLESCAAYFDLALSADVFVYIGALDDIFARLSKRLTDKALFAFTVQSLENNTTPWALGDDHRYAHSLDYLSAIADITDMPMVSTTSCDL
ncbi:MAG: SAM-dependent methyltransferase, partial [Micavibrio aeruginosavorus]